MKNLITIGLPSKGRLKEGSISFFEKNNLKPTSKGGERNYFAQIENLPNSKIIYLHAKEIIQRLGDGTIDIGISGLDLLQESSMNLKNKIEIYFNPKHTSMNKIIETIYKTDLKILDLSTKNVRLEEVFVNLIKDN